MHIQLFIVLYTYMYITLPSNNATLVTSNPGLDVLFDATYDEVAISISVNNVHQLECIFSRVNCSHCQ